MLLAASLSLLGGLSHAESKSNTLVKNQNDNGCAIVKNPYIPGRMYAELLFPGVSLKTANGLTQADVKVQVTTDGKTVLVGGRKISVDLLLGSDSSLIEQGKKLAGESIEPVSSSAVIDPAVHSSGH